MLWTVTDGDGVIEVLIDDDTAALHRAAPALFVDLKDHVVELDGVVAVDCPLGLDREHAIEIGMAAGDKGGFRRLLRFDSKSFVELTDIAPL